MHTSKAVLMHEIECFNLGQNRVFYCYLIMLAGDIQVDERREDLRMVNETTNSNYPWEDMHCPAVVCIMTEC